MLMDAQRNTLNMPFLAVDWFSKDRELSRWIFDAVTGHPDVEHLVADHVRIKPKVKGRRSEPPDGNTQGPTLARNAQKEPLDALLERIRRQEVQPLPVGEGAGRLGDLQVEQAQLVARLLSAAIEATKRWTPDHPEGLIQIHPAAKLATGGSSLTASKAADLFKRLLGPLTDELDGDLREAYQIALGLRPKSGKVASKR